MSTKQKSGAALTAKAIKERLKTLYPNVKFSVTSEVFSMGNSVNISWTDGPSTDDVESITNQYQNGSYDSMEDIYNYREIDSALGCPGAKYVQCSRSMSHEYKEKVLAKAYEHYGNFEPNDHSAYRKMIEIEKLFFPYPVADAIDDGVKCNNGALISGLEYEVINDVDTRDDSEIFVVKVITKVNDFKLLNRTMHGLGGYYSRFKKGFIFKEDPTDKLKEDASGKCCDVPINKDGEVETQASPVSPNNGATLLDKFDTVEVTADERFPAEDMLFCREQDELYKEAHVLFSDILAKAQAFSDKYEKGAPIGRKYVSAYGKDGNSPGLSQYRNSIVETNQGFIDIICTHFSKKYNVSIEAPKWEDIKQGYGINHTKPRTDPVQLDYILESIHQQMGGMTFDEKALCEIKSIMKPCVFNDHNQKWKMSIAGLKLVVDGFYSSYICTIFKQYEISTKEHNTAFFKALSHFEYDSAELHQKYSNFAGRYTIREETGIYNKHAISSSVIRSIKVYKNGKVEFEFIDSNKARLFAKKYCGYVGQQSA